MPERSQQMRRDTTYEKSSLIRCDRFLLTMFLVCMYMMYPGNMKGIAHICSVNLTVVILISYLSFPWVIIN